LGSGELRSARAAARKRTSPLPLSQTRLPSAEPWRMLLQVLWLLRPPRHSANDNRHPKRYTSKSLENTMPPPHRLVVNIPASHKIEIELPVTVPVGPAEILVIPQHAPVEGPRTKLTLEELLARRVDGPPGSGALTDDDIQRAIVKGALGGNA
jgi:hypothetical protein